MGARCRIVPRLPTTACATIHTRARRYKPFPSRTVGAHTQREPLTSRSETLHTRARVSHPDRMR